MFISYRDYFPHFEGEHIIAYREGFYYRYYAVDGMIISKKQVRFPHAADCQSFYSESSNLPYYSEREYYGDSLQFSKPAPRILPFGVAYLGGETIMCNADTLSVEGIHGIKLYGIYYLYAWNALLLLAGPDLRMYDSRLNKMRVYSERLGKLQLVYHNFVLMRKDEQLFVLDLATQRCAELRPFIHTTGTVVVEQYLYRLGRRFDNFTDYLLDMHNVNYASLRFAPLTLIGTDVAKVEQISITEESQEKPALFDFQDASPVVYKTHAHRRKPVYKRVYQTAATPVIIATPILVSPHTPKRKSWFSYFCCLK